MSSAFLLLSVTGRRGTGELRRKEIWVDVNPVSRKLPECKDEV